MDIDPYQVLGVAPTSTAAEIKAAWHRRVRQYHPDQVQQAGPQIRAAAEDMTKLLNAAYDEIQSRATTASTAQRTFARRLHRVFNARELVQRSGVALEYSDALMNRWRTTAKLVHNAEHALGKIHAELRQHSEQVDEVFELVFAGSGLIDRSVTKLLNHRLIDDVSARVKGLQLLVQQLDRRPIKSSEQSRVQQQVMDDAVVHAQKLMERLPSDPAAITALLEGIVQEARRVTEIAQRRIKTAEFAHRDAKRSIGRARDRLRQAASEAKGFNKALTAARQAVDHMILMTWTAHGLCMVEHKQAVKSEEKWRTERTLNDAKALKERADRLEAEQLKGEALDVEAHIARLRKSKKMLDEGVVTAGERIESLLSWRDDLPNRLMGVGPTYMTKLEEQLAVAFQLSTSILTR